MALGYTHQNKTEMPSRDGPGDHSGASMIDWREPKDYSRQCAIITHFDEFSESQVNKNAAAIGTRLHVHFGNLKVSHFTNYLRWFFILKFEAENQLPCKPKDSQRKGWIVRWVFLRQDHKFRLLHQQS